jgi:uncharacterized protein (TIGR02391 family)
VNGTAEGDAVPRRRKGMNLQTRIEPELWLAISSTYEAGNYSHAILDAVHFMSDLIREKANVDGDGPTLVSQALGGEIPKLKLSKLQTQTERDLQKGIEQILRGIYQAIRNPRSHEQITDAQETADSIVYFLNYLIGIINQSQEPFSVSEFLSRVFDPDFVETERYSDLLTSEIPPGKKLDTLIEIYRKKKEGDGKKLSFIINSLIKNLTDDQITDFISVVSDELKTTHDNETIRMVLQFFPPELWPRVNETAKLRIENKLIQSIKEGKWGPSGNRGTGGGLATWSKRFIRFFTTRDQAARLFLEKMNSHEAVQAWYAMKFFFSEIPQLVESNENRQKFINAICRRIRQNDLYTTRFTIDFMYDAPDEWLNEIYENLVDMTDPDKPAYYLRDGRPFLKEVQDDVPF